MDKQRLQELAGVQLNEDKVEAMSEETTDDIIEALAMHFAYNDIDDSAIKTHLGTLHKYIKSFREQRKEEKNG